MKSTGQTFDEREKQFEIPPALFLLPFDGEALSLDEGCGIVYRIMGHILESNTECLCVGFEMV
jgi:hypothetical protein